MDKNCNCQGPQERKVPKTVRRKETKKRDSLFIIIFENNSQNLVLAKRFFRALTKVGTFLNNYHGIYPTSQVNHWAIVAGSIFDFYVTPTNDNVDLPFSSVFDLLDKKGISWKVYEEGYPSNTIIAQPGNQSSPCSCFSDAGNPFVHETIFENEGGDTPWYVRKHNFAISFNSIRNDPKRCAKIVNASQLQQDILDEDLPEIAFYTPTMFNDGHDTNAIWSDEYLTNTWSPIFRDPRFVKNRIIIITYDENGLKEMPSGPSECTKVQQGPVYTLFLGPNVKSEHFLSSFYTHYNLLRTIENHFNLGTLGRCDSQSSSIHGFLKKDKANEKRRVRQFIQKIEKAISKAIHSQSIIIPYVFPPGQGPEPD